MHSDKLTHLIERNNFLWPAAVIAPILTLIYLNSHIMCLKAWLSTSTYYTIPEILVQKTFTGGFYFWLAKLNDLRGQASQLPI